MKKNFFSYGAPTKNALLPIFVSYKSPKGDQAGVSLDFDQVSMPNLVRYSKFALSYENFVVILFTNCLMYILTWKTVSISVTFEIIFFPVFRKPYIHTLCGSDEELEVLNHTKNLVAKSLTKNVYLGSSFIRLLVHLAFSFLCVKQKEFFAKRSNRLLKWFLY